MTFEEATARVSEVKGKMDTLINQFLDQKLSKVRDNEAMIVSYKYDPRVKEAERQLDNIKAKLAEQMKTETSQ